MTLQRLIAKLLFGVFLVACCDLDSGCSQYPHSGDLGQFLLKRIVDNGGKIATLQTPPQLQGEWKYSDENIGTIIESDDITLEQVDRFLRAIYGAPSKGGNTPAGDIQWVVPAKTSGVSIWYCKGGKGIQISILKPLRF
jgi:hypothetical protein